MKKVKTGIDLVLIFVLPVLMGYSLVSELYHEGYGLLRYVPETRPTVARMKLAQEYLYRQTIA